MAVHTIECNDKELDIEILSSTALTSENVDVLFFYTNVLILMINQRWVFGYEYDKCAENYFLVFW